MNQDTALLVVDVQNDFCPGGALPVAGGDQVVPVLNRRIDRFARAGQPVILSRDWHPAHTNHFQAFGGPWPVHCVQGTSGAAFHPDLHVPPEAVIVSKGVEPDEDGYSAFVGRDAVGTRLVDLLHRLGVRRLVVGGLATDYCVVNTVVEGLAAGFAVDVVEPGIRAVDLQTGDGARAEERMKAAGARFLVD